MSEVSLVANLLKEAGFTPVWVLLSVIAIVMVMRSWSREDSFYKRQLELNAAQDEFNEDILSELKTIKAEYAKCQSEMRDLYTANAALERWKATCQDLCENSETLHRVRTFKQPPRQ